MNYFRCIFFFICSTSVPIVGCSGRLNSSFLISAMCMLSSSSESDHAIVHFRSASDILQSWGLLDLDSNLVPILYMPEPIVYLVLGGFLDSVMVLANWHDDLISPRGDALCHHIPFHQHIACPDADSQLWNNANTFDPDPAADVNELNGQDFKMRARCRTTNLMN